MTVPELLQQLNNAPETLEFADVIAVITAYYHYTPTRFSNGSVVNEAGANEGACRIFAFAQLHGLDMSQTLACFGRFYREDVLLHPDAKDHANIRNFMQTGWAGVRFDSPPLRVR